MGLYKLWALEALKKTDDVNRGISTNTNVVIARIRE